MRKTRSDTYLDSGTGKVWQRTQQGNRRALGFQPYQSNEIHPIIDPDAPAEWRAAYEQGFQDGVAAARVAARYQDCE